MNDIHLAWRQHSLNQASWMWRYAGWLARSRWRRLEGFSRKDEDTFHEDYQTAVNTEPDVYVIWMLSSIRFADTTPQTTPQPWVKRLPDKSPIQPGRKPGTSANSGGAFFKTHDER